MTPGNDGRLASVPPRFVYSLNSILLSLVPSASRSPVTTGFVPSTNSEEIEGLFWGEASSLFFFCLYITLLGVHYMAHHIFDLRSIITFANIILTPEGVGFLISSLFLPGSSGRGRKCFRREFFFSIRREGMAIPEKPSHLGKT